MKRIHIILIIVIAVGIGVVVTSITSASTTVTFDKAFANEGKEYQIKGVLDKTKPVEYDPIKNPNLFSFYVFDKKKEERKVIFNGTKPENFEHTDTISLNGIFGSFKAYLHMRLCSQIVNFIWLNCAD